MGEVGVSFDIASTYGRYYFHTRASYNNSSACAGMLASSWFGLGLVRPTEPMRLLVYWDRGPIGTGDAGYVINDGWGGNGYDTWPWLKGMTHAVVWSGSNIPQPYDVPIPAATITCPITIVPVTTGPSRPVVSPVVSSGGSCIVGTAYSISFTSSDSNGHKLRYGIDWDNDGTVDQYVPPIGYVQSGSTQTASRTYSTSG